LAAHFDARVGELLEKETKVEDKLKDKVEDLA
jgi:hypothetical protein